MSTKIPKVAAISWLAYMVFNCFAVRAEAPFSLAGTTWQLDTAGQSYSKVEFNDNELLRYYFVDGKEQVDKVEGPRCKAFKYSDISIADIKTLKPSFFKNLEKSLSKRKMTPDKRYSALITSTDCTGGDIYIAISKKTGIYIVDDESGFLLVEMRR